MKIDKLLLSDKFIVVVGDLMLDKHIWGEVERISPEAPVPVVDVSNETAVPGGASNVAYNIKNLGANVGICGVIGDDDDGRLLTDMLKKIGCDVSGIISDKKRHTTVKTRIIAHNQHLVRVDKEVRSSIDLSIENRILAYLKEKKDNIDGVIIEDYGKGVITASLVKNIISLFSDKRIPITVDPKEAHYKIYENVSILTPNHHEAGNMFGKKITDTKTLIEVGKGIVSELSSDALLITQGKDGMTLFDDSGIWHVPTVAKEEYDVTGAGDTVIAVLTLMLAMGYNYVDASVISNIAAGIVVEKPGVVPISFDELNERIKDEKPVVERIS